MAKQLLITGGTGFIGRNLAFHAMKNGYEVTSLSRSAPKDGELIPDVKYLYADVSNIEQLSEQLMPTRFEYIVNLSGRYRPQHLLTKVEKVFMTHTLKEYEI